MCCVGAQLDELITCSQGSDLSRLFYTSAVCQAGFLGSKNQHLWAPSLCLGPTKKRPQIKGEATLLEYI